MEASFLRDLVDGKNDWLNIQSVLRTSFKFFNDLIVQQRSEIEGLNQKLEKLQGQLVFQSREWQEWKDEAKDALESKADKIEVSNLLETKAGLVDLLKMKSASADIFSILEQKADTQAVTEALESKASKAAVTNALKKKVNRTEIEPILESKLDKSQIESLFQALDSKAEKADVRSVPYILFVN